MLHINSQQATLANFNPRSERHGDERVPAGDIKLQFAADSAILDEIETGLRALLFREPRLGEQQDLIAPDRLTAVRFPRIEALRWDEEFPGYQLCISEGLGLTEPLELHDVTLRKIQFDPIEGGSVQIACSVMCHPDETEAGRLCALIQQSVVLSLIPPQRNAPSDQGDLLQAA